MMRTVLSVNLNKIALLRNSRIGEYPSPVRFGRMALDAGVAGLTVHPRPDQRHIRTYDVPALARLIRTYPGKRFNIEGNPFHNLMDHVRTVRPDQVTFVPDATQQLTSDHGFDLCDGAVCRALRPVIARAKALGVRVSLFMDPEPEMMAVAKDLGADRVELYTEAWAKEYDGPQAQEVLQRYVLAARAAHVAGLGINAGHDLTLDNLAPFLRACRYIHEVSIGHGLTIEALRYGWVRTMHRYEALLDACALQE